MNCDAKMVAGLSALFLIRLERLAHSRAQLTRKTHWVWDFARDDFVTMSCIIVPQQRAKNIDLVNLAQNGENVGVLETPTNEFLICNHENAAEGCYLFCNRTKLEWIRIGKATGRPIQERLIEHQTANKLKRKSDNDNKF